MYGVIQVPPKLNCNINGSIREIKKSYAKVNNVWVPLKAGFRKVSSSWGGGNFLNLLEYIQSSGSQHIDTGFKPNQNTRVVMDIEILSSSGTTAAIFGGRNSTSSSNNSFVLWKISGSAFRSDYRSTTTNISVTPTGRHKIDKNKNKCTIDSTSITHSAGTFQSSYNLMLFANNGMGTIDSRKIHAKLYSCQVYDNDVLIRDYIGINYEGSIGLWDQVNEVFYPNKGTGNFVAGPSI